MRANFSRYGLRGGVKDSDSWAVSLVCLTNNNGTMNWAKLKREVQKAIDLVEADEKSPGLVQRIEIQIQRGPK